jgi:type I restriction enzyme S subunit
MKTGWLAKPFEDCIEKVTYTAKIQRKDFLDEGKFPIVSQEESFINGYWNDAADVFSVPTPVVIFGDHTKVLKYVDFDFVLGADGVKLLPPKAFLLPKFFYYQLQSVNLDSLGYARHYKLLRELGVRYPATHEQQRIVTLLDEAFDGIATAKAHAEKNLQNARAIFESQREVLLSFKQGWLEAPLAALCEVKHGYAFEGEFFASDGDYVLLTPGSFFETGGYRERGEKTKFFVGEIPGNYILDAGDLLVAMTEQAAGLLGSPLLVPESNRFLHNQRLGLVAGKIGVPWLNEFFFHVFNLGRVRQEIHGSASGVKVRHTSPGRIGAVKVAYPKSLAEQDYVTTQLGELSGECERLESIYRKKLAALNDLKKSLLHRAFNGDL